MPLARYFGWVGSVLLALLFIADASLPKSLPAAKGEASTPLIRIHSEHKWPARMVYDTSAPIIGSVRSENPDAGSPDAAGLAPATEIASHEVREAFAEQRTTDARPPAANPKKPKAGRQHLKLVRKQAARPVRFAAQPPPFGWFAPTTW